MNEMTIVVGVVFTICFIVTMCSLNYRFGYAKDVELAKVNAEAQLIEAKAKVSVLRETNESLKNALRAQNPGIHISKD